MPLSAPTHLFPHRVVVQQNNTSDETVDPKGNRTPNWKALLSSLKGRFSELSAEEKLFAQRAGRETTAKYYCATAIPSGGGSIAGTAKTVADAIKGTQANHNQRHRVKFVHKGVTRYFAIDGASDADEIGVMTTLMLTEHEDAWWNN